MSDLIKRKSIRNMYSCLDPEDKVRVAQVLTDIDAIPSVDTPTTMTGVIDAIREAEYRGYMKAVEDRPKGEWIPCSERLPKRQGYYICTCKDGSKYKRTTVVKWSNGWQLTGTRSYWIVLAWMPLPKPYEETDHE